MPSLWQIAASVLAFAGFALLFIVVFRLFAGLAAVSRLQSQHWPQLYKMLDGMLPPLYISLMLDLGFAAEIALCLAYEPWLDYVEIVGWGLGTLLTFNAIFILFWMRRCWKDAKGLPDGQLINLGHAPLWIFASKILLAPALSTMAINFENHSALAVSAWTLIILSVLSVILTHVLVWRIVGAEGLGEGMGCKRRPYWYWAIAQAASIAPIAMLFIAAFIIILGLFAPLISVVEILGGC